VSAGIRFACDGHRHGQPCRGAFNSGTTDLVDAYRLANHADWHFLYPKRGRVPVLLCHSSGHDEETETS
jgi:hypothetical protein